MIFHEIYGCYYTAVEKIIARALEGGIGADEMKKIVDETAFSESFLSVLPPLSEGRWPFLRADGSTPLPAPPHMPPTAAQKMFLKAVSLDPRVRLFGDFDFPDVEPLFTQDDLVYFDRAADGDPYTDAGYIARFRLLLVAAREKRKVMIDYRNRSGRSRRTWGVPSCFEYSERDDKFRLCFENRNEYYNLGRIAAAEFTDKEEGRGQDPKQKRQCVLELCDGRQALERFNLAFVYLEKEVERTGKDTYRVMLWYDPEDETELVIGVLSFGPFVKAVSPAPFVEEIKARLLRQYQMGLH